MIELSEKTGLLPRHWDLILGIIKRHAAIDRAVLFGSRAVGTFGRASDVDLAFDGNNLTAVLRRMSWEFDESSLPYKVDLIDMRSLANSRLRDEIRRYGREIYKRDTPDNGNRQPV